VASYQPHGSAPAVAVAQVGGSSIPNTINPGQSFSAVSPAAVGSSVIALGSMGAGGGGSSLAYQQTATFIFNGTGSGTFLLNLLRTNSVGTGFDSATFELILNGRVLDDQSFLTLAAAQAFFSNDLIDILLGSGPNDLQLALNETMGGAKASVSTTRQPAACPPPHCPRAWTMMMTGLAGFGFTAFRRQKRGVAFAKT
jgi:hypothetical protein